MRAFWTQPIRVLLNMIAQTQNKIGAIALICADFDPIDNARHTGKVEIGSFGLIRVEGNCNAEPLFQRKDRLDLAQRVESQHVDVGISRDVGCCHQQLGRQA